MTLYLIGIGLHDHKDITVRGLEYVKSCKEVYLEYYTSILGIDPQELSEAWGVEVKLASRDLVEKEAENTLLTPAKEHNVALLVIGDVFGATTHTDLAMRAHEQGITCKVVHNASILTAVGVTGLELYKFGKTTSIVFPDDDWLPTTPYEVAKKNKEHSLHTLCLLDIKVAESNKSDMIKDNATPQPPRFMTVAQAIDVLLRIEDKEKQNVITKELKAVGVARLGQPDAHIAYGTLAQLQEHDFGGPLHSLILLGDLHFLEEEALARFALADQG